MVIDLDNSNMPGFVFGHRRSIILLAYNGCCEKNGELLTLFKRASETNSELLFGRLDVFDDKNRESIVRLRLTAFPTILLMKHDKECGRVALGRADFQEELLENFVEKAKNNL